MRFQLAGIVFEAHAIQRWGEQLVAYRPALGLDILERCEHVAAGHARLAAVAFEASHNMTLAYDFVVAERKASYPQGQGVSAMTPGAYLVAGPYPSADAIGRPRSGSSEQS